MTTMPYSIEATTAPPNLWQILAQVKGPAVQVSDLSHCDFSADADEPEHVTRAVRQFDALVRTNRQPYTQAACDLFLVGGN